MAHLTLSNLKHKKSVSIPKTADVVIIGAGMSGLYTAWRIMLEQPKTKVLIFERSLRTGGRLDSDVVEFADGREVKEEEGGMRFTFDNMDDLMSLFLELDLTDQIVPFPMDSGGNNRLTFRGTSFNNQDAAASGNAVWASLFHLQFDEQGQSAGQIVGKVFEQVADANGIKIPTHLSPEFWQNFRDKVNWKGQSIVDWTLWNLFSDFGYSNECLTMLYRTLGFNGVFLSNVNAGIAFQLLEEFPSDPYFKTLKEGFSTLPNALVKALDSNKIFLNTQLDSIGVTDGKEGYTLKYTHPNTEEGTKEIQAKKVILGLPRLDLEKLFINSDALNKLPGDASAKLWNNLQKTENYPLLKINMYYDKAWWDETNTGHPSVEFGPNTSDLPLGFVYPFYSIDKRTIAALEYEEWHKKHHVAIDPSIKPLLEIIDKTKYEAPAALTIYCDYLNINFWKGLQNNGEMFNSAMQTTQNNKKPQTIFPASKAVVAAATKYFKVLFDTENVPQPVMTSARIWAGSTEIGTPSSEQFGYGVHFWSLGARDNEVQEYLTEPMPNLYTCGESFSDYQGWVEGALRSADRVLKKGFQIKPAKTVFEEKTGKKPSVAVREAYQKEITKSIKQYIDPAFDPTDLKQMKAPEPIGRPMMYGVKYGKD